MFIVLTVMAAVVRKWFASLLTDKKKDDEEEEAENGDETTTTTRFVRFLGPFECYLVTAQSFVIWEKPWRSSCVVLLVNAIFWFAARCCNSCRFYCVVATSLAIVHVYRTWTNQIWPEIRVPVCEGEEEEDVEGWTTVNPQVLSVPEIGRYLGRLAQIAKCWTHWLTAMRRERPGTFCLLVTGTLSLIGSLGSYVSGMCLAYVTVMAVLLGPGFVVHVRPLALHLTLGPSAASHSGQGPRPRGSDSGPEDEDLDDFLPETSPETLELLARATNLLHLDEDSMVASQELGLEDLVHHNDSEDVSLGELPGHDESEDQEEEEPSALSFPTTRAATISFFPGHFDTEEDSMAPGLDLGPRPNATRQGSVNSSEMDTSDYEMVSDSELS